MHKFAYLFLCFKKHNFTLFINNNMYLRQKAIDYAYEFWNKRNPKFYNFDSLGGDCTNFISQCLYYGSIPMDYSPNGWYYVSLTKRSPSFSGVNEFFNYAITNTKSVGIKAKVVTIDKLEVGDVVQMLQKGDVFHHTLIITKITGKVPELNNIYVTCHTNDAKDKQLSNYYFKKIRFLKIIS